MKHLLSAVFLLIAGLISLDTPAELAAQQGQGGESATAPLYRRHASSLLLAQLRPTLTDGSTIILQIENLPEREKQLLSLCFQALESRSHAQLAGVVDSFSLPQVADQLTLLRADRPALSEIRPLSLEIFETRGFGTEASVRLLVFQEGYQRDVRISLELNAHPIITGITWEESK